jgi:hypothetical protein
MLVVVLVVAFVAFVAFAIATIKAEQKGNKDAAGQLAVATVVLGITSFVAAFMGAGFNTAD